MDYYYVMFLIASEKEYIGTHTPTESQSKGTTNPIDVDLTKLCFSFVMFFFTI